MAVDYALTSRFKIPVPVYESNSWLDYLTHWAELIDVMTTVLCNKDYVTNGLSVVTDPTSLNFTYAAGSVSILSETVDITSGNGSAVASAFNWLYVQSDVLKISTYPPTGITYVPIACLQTDDTGVVGFADLRPSPPTVRGVSITPYQVNPSSNINLADGKRVLHADSNVGSNIVMFNNNQIQTILNWSNRTSANDWTTVSVSNHVSSNAKFVILNCYMATYNVNFTGWSVLEVKTSSDHDNNVYNFRDYGHSDASVLNASQVGHANQIMLPITSEKKFQVRSLVDNLGGTGAYYASIKIIGYVV